MNNTEAQPTRDAQPTIEHVWFDLSINGHFVSCEPFRAYTRHGDAVDITKAYRNGGLITVEGYRIKKDGTQYARPSVLGVPAPAALVEAIKNAELQRARLFTGNPMPR